MSREVRLASTGLVVKCSMAMLCSLQSVQSRAGKAWSPVSPFVLPRVSGAQNSSYSSERARLVPSSLRKALLPPFILLSL